jgi:lipoyl(octanoyl) transferase
MPAPVIIRQQGRMPYAAAFEAMQRFTAARDSATRDELWLVEHDPVYTLGTHADPAHLLAPGDTPVVQTDRGGQVTWHGPGQLVVYVLLDLQRARLGVRDLVCALERAIISMLGGYGIAAAGKPGAPGVYCGARKIASVGLRIRRHCSYHGISINVCNDLQPFLRMNTCGYAGLAVTRTCDLGGPTDTAECARALLPLLLAELKLEAPVNPQP